MNALLPVLVVCSSLIPGAIIFVMGEERQNARRVLNLAGAVAKVLLIAFMLRGVAAGEVYEVRFFLLPNVDLILLADPLSMLFVSLSAVLWLLTTIYAIGYLEGSPNRSRFFGFFSICVSATTGIALAGNLLTFLIFYEVLTLTTYPLVVHRGTEEALRAGRIYLAYTVCGGVLVLVGAVWLHTLVGPFEFTERGVLSGFDAAYHPQFVVIFVLLIVGLGVKAALVPLHGWLPTAMVAPAPVSALLHAVAVVKAGAFGIVRVVYDVFGVEFAHDLGLTGPLAVAASVTIIYGSLRALYQDDLKRRLAFSTVSQVSYIILGVATAGPLATVGGIVHLVHQGLMKITLFFCAGNLAEELHIHSISEMNGVARRMPWTMSAFTLAAFGMIGVPPMAGFVSKWYLGIGAVEADLLGVVVVLVVSTILNAAYFLPVLYVAWFKGPHGGALPPRRTAQQEAPWSLLAPPLMTAALALFVGLAANTFISPLTWARLIALREYTP